MRLSRVVRSCLALAILLFVSAASSPASAQEKGRKPLSEAVRAALEKEPPAAVQKRFTEAIEAGTLEYAFDPPAMNALGLELMQKGETEKAVAVMSIMGVAAGSMAAETVPGMREAMAAEKEARQKERDARAAAAASEGERAREQAAARLGPPRDDLERFHGLFAVPEKENWSLFLVRNCDGHLVMGPMWADVSPWTLRSIDDTTFEYPGDSFMSAFRLEITVDANGKATSLRHTLEDVATPNPRTADLPSGFLPKCEGGR